MTEKTTPVPTSEQPAQRVHHGAFTGLPDRFLLADRLEVALAQARRYDELVALVVIDLNKSTERRAALGLDAGDELTSMVAEVFEAELIAAIRGRESGESVLAAFRRFILEIRGLLASKRPEDAQRLATVSRIVTASPALRAREREITAQYTQALAALIADETGATADDVSAWVAANALMGVHRALVDHVRRRVLAGTPNPRVAREVRSRARRALELIEHGLGDYALKAR